MSTRAAATIEALAPGKVVLWGEYAVLAGAPALVMAVDRYARCAITLPGAGTDTDQVPPDSWRFSSTGFVAPTVDIAISTLLGPSSPPADSPAWTAWHVLQSLAPPGLPERTQVELDTAGFYRSGAKLGLGSSAAVCVALYGALCELLSTLPAFAGVAAIHHRLQGHRGSGVDIAAAWFGGLLRFERDTPAATAGAPRITQAALPAGLTAAFLWAGHPAVTTEHLARFAAWRARGHTGPLDALGDASQALFADGDAIESLKHYVRCLKDIDRAATLAIYDDAHRTLDRLAMASGVVYKPCGAGGGDIGAAFSYDSAALAAFISSARDQGFTPIRLETATHGIQVRR